MILAAAILCVGLVPACQYEIATEKTAATATHTNKPDRLATGTDRQAPTFEFTPKPFLLRVPAKKDILEIPLATHVNEIHQLFPHPDLFGMVSGTNFRDDVIIDTSYTTTGGMGPLPGNDRGYFRGGHPQFTDWRLAGVLFAPGVGAFDP